MKILDKAALEKAIQESLANKTSASGFEKKVEEKVKEKVKRDVHFQTDVSLQTSGKADVQKTDLTQLVKHKALALLGRREYTRKELELKLLHGDFLSEDKVISKDQLAVIIERVVNKLIDEKLLSDQRYCEMHIRSRIHKYSGPFKIRMELQQKGVGAALIEASLKNSNIDWFDLALQAARKKQGVSGSGGSVMNQKDKARLQRFLGSRGFLQEHIRHVIDTL